MPLQNMSHERVNCRIVCPVTGSRSSAPDPFEGPYGGPEGQPVREGEQLPDPATIKIFPFARSVAWTGLIGIVFGNVVHCPCTLA